MVETKQLIQAQSTPGSVARQDKSLRARPTQKGTVRCALASSLPLNYDFSGPRCQRSEKNKPLSQAETIGE